MSGERQQRLRSSVVRGLSQGVCGDLDGRAEEQLQEGFQRGVR